MKYYKLFNKDISFSVQTKVLPTKGNLVYEYNPLRNYRLSQNMYEYQNQLYSELELKSKFNITLNSNQTEWQGVPTTETKPILHEKGELVDFNTNELKISLNHPIQMIPQHSYDGSVNLIINDGVNIPRLINSRFSATGRNTYEIVDRKGNNDTNIYDQGNQFDIDTSLYKRVTNIPKIKFNGVYSGGNLKVGNYHFYFKFSDADGNETDFVGESGLVSIFIGFDSHQSIHTGQKNENSHKQVIFQVSNIDSAYQYVSVYYSRSSAEGQFNDITEYAKINKTYLVNSANVCNVNITGFEETEVLNVSDINLFYNTVDAVNTSAVCQNMLFMANIHKPDIPYLELQDLSLRFLPYLHEEQYSVIMNETYSFSNNSTGYIDPKYIYDKTGYWGEEIYRLGIVYILPNGTLSPVFNIRGAYNISTYNDSFYTKKPVYKIKDNIKTEERESYIDYDESNYYIIDGQNKENVKGVVSFKPNTDTNTIYGIDIRVDSDTITELKKHVKGYFFVRQKRIPNILVQGITINIDEESRTPTLATADGVIVDTNYDNTHVTTEDINDVNCISEGFLSRYSFGYKEKENSAWKDIGKIVAIGAGVILSAAATVFTLGLATPLVIGVGAAIAGGGLLVGAMIKEGVDEVVTWAQKTSNRKKKKLDGRNTKPIKGYEISENDTSRLLGGSFFERLIIKDPSKSKVQGIICPDYEINQEFYNQIFTGNKHLIKSTKTQSINGLNGFSSNYFTSYGRHFYIPQYYDKNIQIQNSFNIIGVPDGVKAVGVNGLIFRGRAGEAEEAHQYEFVGEKFSDETMDLTSANKEKNINKVSLKKINSDIIRGMFGAYLAFDDESNTFSPAETVNIYIPEYSEANINNYFDIRMQDNSTYSAISERFDINEQESGIQLSNDTTNDFKQYVLFRGDCYICQFTHRLNRNFNDPSAPYNDVIVDSKSWKENYDPDKPETFANINLGDVNAVQLGMWVTFRIRSSNNLNIRTLDGSDVAETAMSGHEKGYYPYYPMSTEGSYKMSDSQVYNKGFAKSLSDRWNVQVPDVPHIKNWFGTRIMYSDIHINDAFKNGFRVFRGTNYRDYTREYGEITKIVSLESNLLVIFEHGIGLAPVNERAVAGQGAGGNIYINTSNVLPENLMIISDMYGTQWPESVLKVPGKTGNSAQYVYGVDTIAKKIWRTDGQRLECISDMRVQEFLNNNITLGERELTPKIGIRNVKTVYNAFKRDVLFTFYDNTYGFEEKVWNLCWNELLEKFVTFYSWVPSYMENINNIPFSFNRDTSKWIAKLGTSHSENSIADGITLSNVIINNKSVQGQYVDNFKFPFVYVTKEGKQKTVYYEVAEEFRQGFIGVLSLSNRTLPNDQLLYLIEYSLERDSYLNYKNFDIIEIDVVKEATDENISETKGITLPNDAKYSGIAVPVYALIYKSNKNNKIYYESNEQLNEVYYLNNDEFSPVYTEISTLLCEMYNRNKEGNSYADDIKNSKNYINYDANGIPISLQEEALIQPIYKNITGKRVTLNRNEQLNPDKIVTLLNIRANISLVDDVNGTNQSDAYYNLKAGLASGTSLIDAGYYESTVAITPKWNLQFLSTDFWKHGQGGIIDIADDIYPTYWYGKQHPFEFEVVVVNDPSVHKIFTNLELVANKAKPESFHYEIVGEVYDFAKDKPNMYFRQEALKALWQHNGADICYDRNFLKIQPKQQKKSADLPHKYYARQDTINDIEDYYITTTAPNKDYRHLSGSEIVYYPTRQEFRIWNHAPAVDLNDLPQDDSRSIIAANCQYLEDKWRININPILVCYKNETWNHSSKPKLPVMNSPIPDKAFENIRKNNSEVDIPDVLLDLEYDVNDMDLKSWLSDPSIYGTSFGEAQNRREVDVRDKFMKVRIRYSGEELAVIDFLNTIYRVSYG